MNVTFSFFESSLTKLERYFHINGLINDIIDFIIPMCDSGLVLIKLLFSDR
jgi:hypothetical protein